MSLAKPRRARKGNECSGGASRANSLAVAPPPQLVPRGISTSAAAARARRSSVVKRDTRMLVPHSDSVAARPSAGARAAASPMKTAASAATLPHRYPATAAQEQTLTFQRGRVQHVPAIRRADGQV
jgi:hypothetical protein